MTCWGGIFDKANTRGQLKDILAKTDDPEVWQDPNKAKELLQKKKRLERTLSTFDGLSQRFNDARTLLQMADEENDDATRTEAIQEFKTLRKEVERLQTERLLSGEADANNCFIEVHAGAGGTESQDWANMLLRMYIRWAEQQGFKVEVVDYTDGEEAGIKTATIRIEGDYAYGLAKTESGVHRLVRISPFDSNARRHTSFSSVFAYPEVDDSVDITIEEKDLRIDTFRSSGAGGQHVNKTESAVRITHLPTNIVTQCQSQRSQHRNREEAMKMLKARLYEAEMQKRQAAQDAIEASKGDNGWGHQIRSYVLHPYKMVKDLRTDVETSNTDAVLDGDLQDFIQAALVKLADRNAQQEAAR